MKPKEINQLAIWLPMKSKELDIKSFKEGYPYLKKGLILHATLTSPVIRYAKNYSNGKKTCSLCLITTEKDTNKIEKWMDEQARKLQEKDIEPKFKLLEVFYG